MQDADEKMFPYNGDCNADDSVCQYYDGSAISNGGIYTLDPSTGLLQPYMKSNQLQVCPDAVGYVQSYPPCLGYGINAAFYIPFNEWGFTGYASDQSQIPLSDGMITTPADTIFLADAATYAYSSKQESMSDTIFPPSIGGGAHGLHINKANTLFMDGHVKAMTVTLDTGDSTNNSFKIGNIEPQKSLSSNIDYYFMLTKPTN